MITLDKILEILKSDDNFHELIIDGDYFYNSNSPVTFKQLSYNSQTTDNETLFFVKGQNFKREYLLNSKAAFYLSEIDYEVAMPAIIVSDVKRAMSLIAQAFYDYPQNKLKTLAFTGTKGKTTTAYFSKTILDQMNGGKTALLSTAQTTLDGQNFFKSELTTPESLDLIRMMAEAVKNGMTHLVMEASSQAYLVKRIYGLTFDVGVFLNFYPDHIGPKEHPTVENYFYCKRQLIHNSRFFIANSDMAHFSVIKEEVADLPHLYFGSRSDNKISNFLESGFSSVGLVAGEFKTPLIGQFNQENALAAALASQVLGASIEQIRSGLILTVVPGRMETLTTRHQSKVYIDYAHNGVSLENLVNVVENHHKGKLYLVLGATGNKGESRRKDFGQVIENHPRLNVFLTQDDSNREDPKAIADEIASYITRPVSFEANREEAIRKAIAEAREKDDAVIIAGKGEDEFQLINGVREPYIGDVAVAKHYL